jgi:prevent-host-death family protein
MAREYDSHEAKARFSEIMRTVMGGQRVTIRYRGVPVVEMRPLEPAAAGLAQRIGELERTGVLGAPTSRSPLVAVSRSAGALERFLADRE